LQPDSTWDNLIFSPAKRSSSSFIVWRIPAPGYAHFRGLPFLPDTRSHDLSILARTNLGGLRAVIAKILIWITRFNPSVEDVSVKIDDKEAT